MINKTTRFLSEWVSNRADLKGRLARLQKAYDALDKYCGSLIRRVEHLEIINEGLREEARCKSSKPAKD